ncbi:MAG TPA: MBL fold metallo-hydrolase [Polyangiaceae bacterium]|jgi:glyoxylase-like metal-dependent hydrolase (beta-lactamase superfamily II)/rhodanese-related sulfurtransferase
MLFRQLFDPASSTYTYLLADEQTREAVLIDTVFEQHARDAALVRELGLKLVTTVDTHCHADHVTGAWLMRAAFGGQIALAAAYGASNVDRPLVHGDVLRFGSHALTVRATPGHTSGCLSLVTSDLAMVFTGDALLVRSAGRTDFQQGSASRLFRSIREQLFTLPTACVVWPAHDYAGRTSTTIGEERAFNPRIGGDAREEDFVGYMQNLGLPHPKQLAVALPGNMRSGEPEGGTPPPAPAWGPVTRTYAGVPEIAPEWVALHRADVHLLDVRGGAELTGELGQIAGAQHIPLDGLRARVAEVPPEKPVVVLCQSGKRSAMGAAILEQAGHARVANVRGGMLAWRELGLPDDGSTDVAHKPL